MNRIYKKDCILFLAVAFVIAVLMRIFYPFPFTYSDTGAYVLQAATDTFNVFRPSGFSKYLQLLHGISSSLYFVFYATFTIMTASILLLMFSAASVLKIRSNILFIVATLLLLTNTRLIASTNLLMSDGIFVALSILYFTTQIHLTDRASFLMAALNLFLLLLMCRIRYSGMFLIPVTVLTFILSFSGKSRLLCGVMVSLPLLLAIYFYASTKKVYVENTRVETFSGFGGWQLINNASVLFPEARELPLSEFSTPQLKSLHKFMQSCPDDIFKDEYAMGTTYMWSNELPYKIYNSYLLQYGGYSRGYGSQWAASGKLYGEYAKILIRHYPVKYFTDFIIPSFLSNFKFRPFEENDIVFHNERMWRDYYGVKCGEYKHKCQFFNRIDPARRICQGILWIFFALGVCFFAVFYIKRKKIDTTFWQEACLLFAILCIIGGQSVSSPNTTWRYTLPILAPMFVFLMSVAQNWLDSRNSILPGR